MSTVLDDRHTRIGTPSGKPVSAYAPVLNLTGAKQYDVIEQPDKGVNMLDELANFIFTAKYARFLDDKKRRETWEEAVTRVESMHLRKYSHLGHKFLDRITWAFDFVRDKRVVPSMRSMQFGGTPVEAHNARIYNCAVRHLDSVRAFAELFYLLLCGCGVGVGVMPQYIDKLPELVEITYRGQEPYIYVIPDTIEGWADSLEVLLKSYTLGNELSGRRVIFDYSLIREKGAKLKTGGGKAPGPFPLMKAHKEITSMLEEMVTRGQRKIRSIDGCDIMLFASDAVLSGGVRRSASCFIFDKNDDLMMNAKVGDWMKENPQRRLSNNSVLLLRDETSKEDFERIVEKTRQWGEPGFVFANSKDMLFNPCFEVGFEPVTEDGRTGVQFCNLTTINGARVKSEKDLMDCAEAAAVIGTLQAGYTDFPYLSKEAEELTKNESLLGVSMLAMMETPEIMLNPELQRLAAAVVVDTNAGMSKAMGIPQASRTTVIKPDGTCGLAVGTVFSGIHPAHARTFFKRVQKNKIDNVYQYFRMFNPDFCEPLGWSETDDVALFPITVPDGAIVKEDLSALEHLEIIKSTQENWVLPGTTSANRKDVTHNVSCTVIVKPDEWESVIEYLYNNRNYFAAVSLLSSSGDKDYQQAPNEAVKTLTDKAAFKWFSDNYVPVDYTLLQEDDDLTELLQEMACAGGQCEI